MSQSLVHAGFSTQGSLSITDLASKTFSFTGNVLHRLSKAGVDPYTFTVAQTAARSFPLSAEGRRRLHDCLERLPSIGPFGSVLWFGFGIECIPRLLAKTDEGVSWIALSAALSECYSDSKVAEILHEMITQLSLPEEFRPSLPQILSLVKSCSGVLGTSNFSLRAGKLMSFATEVRLGVGLLDTPIGAKAKDIAEALLAVGQIARGELSSLTICGSEDACILAQIAEWLFSQPVRLCTKSFDDLIYTNCKDEFPKLLVLLDSNYSSLELTKRSVILRGEHRLFRPGQIWTEINIQTAWDSCLYDCFGNEFKALVDDPKQLGTIFGCCARVFLAIARHEPVMVRPESMEGDWWPEESYGIGFVCFSMKRFPELFPLGNQMRQALALPFDAACATLSETIDGIVERCCCGQCRGDEGGDKVRGRQVCSLALVCTLVSLVQRLSRMNIHPALLLSRTGLRKWCWGIGLRLYEFVLPSWKHRMIDDGMIEDDGTQALYNTVPSLIEESFLMTIFIGWLGSDNFEPTIRNVFHDAIDLFRSNSSFSVTYDRYRLVAAYSESGICVYYSALREVGASVNGVGKVEVIPGHIEWRGGTESYLFFGGGEWDSLATVPSNVTQVKATVESTLSACLEVTETVRHKCCTLLLGDDKGEHLRPFNVNDFGRWAAASVGDFGCPLAHRSLPWQSLVRSCREPEEEEGDVEIMEIYISDLCSRVGEHGYVLSTLYLMTCTLSRNATFRLLRTAGRCSSCCAQYIQSTRRAERDRHGKERPVVILVG